MNIVELDNYNLADAVRFHDRLNHRLWDRSEHLHPEVKAKLMAVARDFQEFLGVPDLDVQDITISGSNAAYNYTDNSDIDLHLVVAIPKVKHDDVYRELFNAKKYQYNDEHDIRIGGADVELYAQPADQPHHSQGIYSLLRNSWISVPRRHRAKIDDSSVRAKYEDLVHRIDDAVASENYERIASLQKKIKNMRQSGLEQQGEFGVDNIVFKLLRVNGFIKKLIDARNRARDQELSLNEQRKKKKKVRYGYGGYWLPGFSFGDSGEGGGDGGGGGESRVAESPDGVSPSTRMFLSEEPMANAVQEFIVSAAKQLGLRSIPQVHLHNDPDWSQENRSFGKYEPETHDLHVNLYGRHLFDILRTTAHELCHARQHEIEALGPDAGDTGSDFENEAHAVAGILMRQFADDHPGLFENASGYIPKNRREARLPQYAMALSVDIKPGEVGRQANKLGLQTGPNGEPGLLMKTANLRESKIKLNTDPNWYGADIGDYKATGPVVNISADQLVGFEPDDKMNQPKSKANVKKIMAGIEQGDQLPPLLVRKYKKGYQVLDGHHRFWAYKKLDVKSIPVQVVPDKDIEELKEGRMPQPSQGPGKIRDLNEPLGPETPPTMPAGTVRVDVSDVYDWYKLGNHISNMKGLGKHDFGAGPPSTIFSFGDEETEHKFIDNLKATGLEVTDIDPRDPKQPPGMKKIKTDPTYNVDEEDLVESLRREFELLEDEVLGEIKMSPSNLRAEAAKTGALAGMEFEMIVPNISNPDDDVEYEPNYDMDERCRSIDQAVEFFHDGDYNGRREVERLRERMRNDFTEWLMEQIDNDWANDKEDVIRNYVQENVDPAEWWALVNDNTSKEEAFEQFVADIADDPNNAYYEEALDEFREEKYQDYDENDWLSDQDLDRMSNIESAYEISWPHWHEESRGGAADINAVADSFSEAIGRPVNASSSYHGARREAGKYVVEPDGSLDPDDSNDTGLEFVSPPLPLDELLSDLNRVKKWADQTGCYTNKSTGLHINISVPDYDRTQLDYVKLALLLGDQYVLDQFGRSSNNYAKSAMGKVQDIIRQYPTKAQYVLDKMRGHMDDFATKAIHSGSTDKYTSINTKEGYIEFRSPGGDWLDANFDKIENTLMRFTVALSAAMDPEAYREEYQKKLYKLLTQNQNKTNVDTIRHFADYVAGKIPQAALRSFVKQAQLARKVQRGKTGSQLMWWEVSNPYYSNASIQVVASTKEEAIDKALGPDGYPSWASTRQTVVAEPVKPYDESPAKAREAEPQPVGSSVDQTNTHTYRAFNTTNNQTIGTFQAGEPGSDSAARAFAELLAREDMPDLYADYEVIGQERQQPQPTAQTAPQQSSGEFTGNWLIQDPQGRTIHRFGGVGNVQSDANRVAVEWLRAHPGSMQAGVTVVPEMS